MCKSQYAQLPLHQLVDAQISRIQSLPQGHTSKNPEKFRSFFELLTVEALTRSTAQVLGLHQSRQVDVSPRTNGAQIARQFKADVLFIAD